MLIFTNHVIDSRAETSSALEPSLPAGSAQQALATLECARQAVAARWKVSQTDSDVDDAESMRTLLPMFQGPGSLLVYLHGYSGTPAACFERCDRLQSLYGLEIVRFSWSSRKCLSADSARSGLAAGFNPALQPDFTRLCGAQHYAQSIEFPWSPDPLASDLDGLTCSWWLVMALTGRPSGQGAMNDEGGSNQGQRPARS